MTSLTGNICLLIFWVSNSTLGQFLSVGFSFQIIQQLGPETVNHFTFWITQSLLVYTVMKERLERLEVSLHTSQAISPGRAQVPLPSGCSKNSNTHSSCYLMKCLVTEQVRVSTEKALPAQYFHYQKCKTETVVSVAKRIMRSNYLAVYMN